MTLAERLARFTASLRFEALPAPLAVLANDALAHGLDFDDTHAASITHASSVVLPTVLALG
jgi:2-methylcitrate dehydratase PrpD